MTKNKKQKAVRVDYKEKFFEVETTIAQLRRDKVELQKENQTLEARVSLITKIKAVLLPYWKEHIKEVSSEAHLVRHEYWDNGRALEFKDEDIISTISKLTEMWGREDEGTALMQEQIDNLMLIIRTQMNDSTRESDRFEQEMKYRANSCPNCTHKLEPIHDRCPGCGWRRS